MLVGVVALVHVSLVSGFLFPSFLFVIGCIRVGYRVRERLGDSAWVFETIGNVKGCYGTGFSEKCGKGIMFVARKTDVQEKR